MKEHCWHIDSYQHAAPNHRDEICCWCGKAICVTGREITWGHGRFNPSKRVVFAPVQVSEEEQECKGRSSEEKS